MHQLMHAHMNRLHVLDLVSQSVKEVLQSLVDDGLVQGDKIGSSNCEFVFLV